MLILTCEYNYHKLNIDGSKSHPNPILDICARVCPYVRLYMHAAYTKLLDLLQYNRHADLTETAKILAISQFRFEEIIRKQQTRNWLVVLDLANIIYNSNHVISLWY